MTKSNKRNDLGWGEDGIVELEEKKLKRIGRGRLVSLDPVPNPQDLKEIKKSEKVQ